MTDKQLSTEIFHDKEFSDDDNVLVVGYNHALLRSLPKGTVTIDSSISKIRGAHAHHGDKTFLTQDLTNFSLNKTFSNVFSMGTMQFEKDLTNILIHIQKHCSEEALLYFPLSPAPEISAFLADEKWKPYTENSPFQKRDRYEIEEAVLASDFESILIEEKTETLSFYSPESLKAHLLEDLNTLTCLQGALKVTCAEELTAYLYKDRNTDHVLSLKSPWLLLTLSNDKNIL